MKQKAMEERLLDLQRIIGDSGLPIQVEIIDYTMPLKLNYVVKDATMNEGKIEVHIFIGPVEETVPPNISIELLDKIEDMIMEQIVEKVPAMKKEEMVLAIHSEYKPDDHNLRNMLKREIWELATTKMKELSPWEIVYLVDEMVDEAIEWQIKKCRRFGIFDGVNKLAELRHSRLGRTYEKRDNDYIR